MAYAITSADLPRDPEAQRFIMECRKYGFGDCEALGTSRKWWVGRNASHEFYLIEKANGVMLRMAGSVEWPRGYEESMPHLSDDPTEEEIDAYRLWEGEMDNNSEFRVRAHRISSIADCSYWGHW